MAERKNTRVAVHTIATQLGGESIIVSSTKVTLEKIAFRMFFDEDTKQTVDSNLLEARNLLSGCGYKKFCITEDDGFYKIEASK